MSLFQISLFFWKWDTLHMTFISYASHFILEVCVGGGAPASSMLKWIEKASKCSLYTAEVLHIFSTEAFMNIHVTAPIQKPPLSLSQPRDTKDKNALSYFQTLDWGDLEPVRLYFLLFVPLCQSPSASTIGAFVAWMRGDILPEGWFFSSLQALALQHVCPRTGLSAKLESLSSWQTHTSSAKGQDLHAVREYGWFLNFDVTEIDTEVIIRNDFHSFVHFKLMFHPGQGCSCSLSQAGIHLRWNASPS